jgi:hypothetical protein
MLLKFLPTMVFTGLSDSAGMGADLRKGVTSPELTLATKAAKASEERSEASTTYFFFAATR